MTGTPLGGLMKLALAGTLAWAWANGHLANIVGRVLGQFNAAPPATTSSTSTTSSSTTGVSA